MPTLTRKDVTVVNNNAPWFVHGDKVWHIRVADVDYRIVARFSPEDDGVSVAAYWSTDKGYPDGADPDLLGVTRTGSQDHWDAVDLLLDWLSIEVEDGWSRPVAGISHRTDLAPVEIVVLFTVGDRRYTQLWDARSMGAHFESFRYDEDDNDAVYKEHPARLYVRVGDELREAQCDRLRSGDDYEVRVFVDGEIVAAARF